MTAATLEPSPTPDNWPVVATNIQIVARVQEPARIMGAWSSSSRAELMKQGIRFFTPALHKSEVLRYTVVVEAEADPGTLSRIQVSDPRGPGINLSADPNLRCDSAGLAVIRPSLPPPSQATVAPDADLPPVPETIRNVVNLALSEYASAVRAGAPLHGPSQMTDNTRLVLLLSAGLLSLASLGAAVALLRRQRRIERRIERRIL